MPALPQQNILLSASPQHKASTVNKPALGFTHRRSSSPRSSGPGRCEVIWGKQLHAVAQAVAAAAAAGRAASLWILAHVIYEVPLEVVVRGLGLEVPGRLLSVHTELVEVVVLDGVVLRVVAARRVELGGAADRHEGRLARVPHLVPAQVAPPRIAIEEDRVAWPSHG